MSISLQQLYFERFSRLNYELHSCFLGTLSLPFCLYLSDSNDFSMLQSVEMIDFS